MAATMLITMCVLLVIAVPVAVSVALAAIAGMTFFTPLPLVLVAQQAFASLDKFPLAAVPFFILAGNLMGEGGISRAWSNSRSRSSAASRAACPAPASSRA